MLANKFWLRYRYLQSPYEAALNPYDLKALKWFNNSIIIYKIITNLKKLIIETITWYRYHSGFYDKGFWNPYWEKLTKQNIEQSLSSASFREGDIHIWDKVRGLWACVNVPE